MTLPAAIAIAQEPQPSLADLRDIVLPPPVSWAPATAGWLGVSLLLAALLLWAGWRAWRRWRANAYRRAALVELEALRGAAAGLPPALAIGRTSALLKRTALARFARDRVAPLHGESWTGFLNATCEGSPFDAEIARSLSETEYAPPAAGGDAEPVLVAAAQWIRHHRGEAG